MADSRSPRNGDALLALTTYARTVAGAEAGFDLRRRSDLVPIAQALFADLGALLHEADADPAVLAAAVLEPFAYDPEQDPTLTAHERTQSRYAVGVLGSAWHEEDRTGVLWQAVEAAPVSDAVPAFARLPWKVKTAAVDGLLAAETAAMQQRLEAMAHTNDPPDWDPRTSLASVTTDDTEPYPEGAFAAALEAAHAEAIEKFPQIVNDTAVRILNDAIDTLGRNGWEVYTDPEPFGPTPVARFDSPAVFFHFGPDHRLDFDTGPDELVEELLDGTRMVLTGPLTNDDAAFIGTVVRVLEDRPAPPQPPAAVAAAFPAQAADPGVDTSPAGPDPDPGAAAHPTR